MRMVPLTVRFGDEELLDYEEISPSASTSAWRAIRCRRAPRRRPSASRPATASCSSDGYEHVLSLHLSEALSATVSSARLAAAEFGGRVTVVDTRTVSIGLALRGARHRAATRGRPARARDPGRRSRGLPSPLAPRVRVRDARVPAAQRAHRPRQGARRRPARRAPAADARRGRGRAARPRARTRACCPSSSGSSARTRGRRAPARRDRARPGRGHRERHRRDRAQCPRRPRSSSWRRSAPSSDEHRPGRRRTRVGARSPADRRLRGAQGAPAPAGRTPDRGRVVLLALLGYEFSGAVRDAWPRLRHADLKLVLLAHVLLAAYYLLFVLGWQGILRAYGIRLGYRAVLGAEMLSMLAKYIPGGVWTPAARVVAARRAGVDNTSVVLATILLGGGLSAVAGVIVLAASLPRSSRAWMRRCGPSWRSRCWRPGSCTRASSRRSRPASCARSAARSRRCRGARRSACCSSTR